jgi:predicted nucleotidyltransferase
MAIFLEPPEFLIGLRLAKSGGSWGTFEHYVERSQPEGVRSGPGDLDLVAYSLRKWLRLALSGNPTVLLLLFSPPESLLVCTERGAALRALAPAIVSRKAGPRFVGYMRAQKERLIGTRGQRRVNRPELIEAHGFDTKYAMHVARLGLQGIELLSTGRLTLPMAEPDRSRVMAIRRGDVPLEDALAEIDEIERKLQTAVENSPLREKPDSERVDAYLIESYRVSWGWE